MKKNLSLDILEARDFELCAKGKRLKLLSQIHRKSLVKRNKNSIHKRISCFSLIQLLSHVRPFVTPVDHSTPSLPVHHQLLEFTQTHVH